MNIFNYYKELQAWSIFKNTYKSNKSKFDALGFKTDWFGRIWKVTNREPDIKLGTREDQTLLIIEMKNIQELLNTLGISDLVSFELTPLENVYKIEDSDVFENAYLFKFTPSYRMTFGEFIFSTILYFIFGIGIVSLIIYLLTMYARY